MKNNIVNLRQDTRPGNIIKLKAQPQTSLKSEAAGRFTDIKNTNILPEIWSSSVTKSINNKIGTSFSSLFSKITNIFVSFKRETSLPDYAVGVDIRNKTSAVTETVTPMTAEQKKMVAANIISRYEKDDPDLAHYGRSKHDDGRKTALDAVSYLTTSLADKSEKSTLTTDKISEIELLIKENKLTFYGVKSRVVNHGDLKIIRDLALNKSEDFYEKLAHDLESLSQLLGTPSYTEQKIDTVLHEPAVLMEETEAMSNEEIEAMDNMEWDDYELLKEVEANEAKTDTKP